MFGLDIQKIRNVRTHKANRKDTLFLLQIHYKRFEKEKIRTNTNFLLFNFLHIYHYV